MKSLPLAVPLGFLLGPFGLLHVGLGHAAVAVGIAVGIAVALGPASGAVLLVPLWLACGAWAAVAASRRGQVPPAPTVAFRPSLAARAPVTVKLPPLGSAGEASGKFCFHCGAHLPSSARFCNRCGASAEAP